MVHQRYVHLVLQVLTAVIMISHRCMWSSEWLYTSLRDDYRCGCLLYGTSTLCASRVTSTYCSHHDISQGHVIQWMTVCISMWWLLTWLLIRWYINITCILCYKYLLQSSWYLTGACDLVNDCIHLYVMTTDVAACYMVHQRYVHLVLQVLTAVIMISHKGMWSSEWLCVSLCDDYWRGCLLDGTSTLRASCVTSTYCSHHDISEVHVI